MTILTAVFLSLYRIENTQANLSLFITFGTVNAIYCSIWDLFMDFSLLQAGARQKLLRSITALRPVSIYYIIMTLDPILRFSWIFYAIFTHDSQHSTIVSFLVAFAEVFRRGIWTLLRVENEHCANVAQYKASRDTPLPYHLNTSTSSVEDTTPPAQQQQQPPAGLLGPAAINPATPGVDQQDQIRPLGQHHRKPSTIPPRTPASQVLHRTPTNVGGGTPQSIAVSDTPAEESGPAAAFRRRYTDTIGKKSILQAMAEAHKQDFEKKRLPLGSEPSSTARRGSARPDEGDDEEIKSEEEEEEDDDEDDETGSVEEERMRVREAEGLVNRARGVNAGSESD